MSWRHWRQVAPKSMAEIPNSWNTLNISKVFRIRGSYPSDLRLKRLSNSDMIYAEWLPSLEDDDREFQGRCNKGKGKRLTIRRTTQTSNPKEAAKIAIKIYEEWRRQLAFSGTRSKPSQQTGKTLADYWIIYYEEESQRRQQIRNHAKWSREEKLKWNAEEYGIANQPWANINADKITSNDLKDYFMLIESRTRNNRNSSGYGMKAQQKTLIRKLFSIAEQDFPGHRFPDFPKISRTKNEVQHLRKEQWERLLEFVLEQTNGVGMREITPDEYKNLQWSKNNRVNQRNWIDLHDALCLQWYFYLRAEDMYRIRSEWFRVVSNNTKKDETVICYLDTTKKDRPKHETHLYRIDGVGAWRRIFTRKPRGHLVLPHITRSEANPSANNVLKTLTFLLKYAAKSCLPEIDLERINWTMIRHTAFRLTLEECPNLGTEPYINSFAANGHTSPDQLRKTYLRYIDAEKTAQTARNKIPTGRFAFRLGRIAQ